MATSDDGFEIVGEEDVQGYNLQNVLPLSGDNIVKIRNWLDPTDYAGTSSECAKHRISHLEGTGDWIFKTEQYQRWRDSDGGGLCIKAVAGAGKSVIAASIISKLSTEEKAPVLYFFFRHIVSANQKPIFLVRDLLAQLLHYSPLLQKDLFKIIDDDCKSLGQLSFNELWLLFGTTIRELRSAYCIIDALDEMDTDCEWFLSDLVRLVETKSGYAKVLVTTRPIPRIEQYFRSTRVLHLVLQPQLVNPDISTYVAYRVNSVRMPIEIQSKIHTIMCKKANGHFLYARLMMDDILDAAEHPVTNGKGLLEALDALPTPMADMYTQMLIEHAHRSRVPQQLQVVILQWVTRAERPLRLLELSSLIDCQSLVPHISANAKSIIRTACGPLLEIFEDETIHPIHHSFTEYLYDQNRLDCSPDLSRFPVLDYKESQRALAITCLNHLSSGWHNQISDISPMPQFNRRAMSHAVLGRRNAVITRFPYLDYAATYWDFHLRKSDASDDSVTEGLYAIFTEDSEVFRAWLISDANQQLGHNPDWREDWTAWTPLHLAARKGIAYFVKLLASKGLPLEQTTMQGYTSLAIATLSGHSVVAQVLLEHGARSKDADKAGLTPLHHAARFNHWKVAKLLVGAGADPHIPKTKEDLGARYGDPPPKVGESPVEYACSFGHLETVKVFKPFLHGEQLQRALHFALVNDHTDVAVELLGCPDVDVNFYFRDHTPLYLASESRNLKVMRLLIEKGACATLLSSEYVRNSCPNGDRRRHSSPLHAFASYDLHRGSNRDDFSSTQTILEGFSLLIEAGIDPNIVDRYGSTILHSIFSRREALIANQSESSDCLEAVLEFLIEKGMDVTAINGNGSSVLHLVAKVTYSILDLLVRHGVDVSAARDSDKNTPLMIAARNNETQMVQYLLQRGVDVNALDYDGNTALHYAIRLNSSVPDAAIVETLIQAGADINARDLDGNTILHSGTPWMKLTAILVHHGFSLESKNKLGQTLLSYWLSMGGREQYCKQLVDIGANPLVRDNQGRTALHCVLQGSHYIGAYTIDILRFLVAVGVDPQSTDINGDSLWHVLATLEANGDPKNQRLLRALLVEYQIPPQARNSLGRSPFDVACSVSRAHHSYELIEFLIANTEVNVNGYDYDQVRPLHLAASFDIRLTCFLLENGANVDVTTREGQTPLMVACRTRQSNIVCALLDHHRKHNLMHKIDRMDKQGRTALQYACRSGVPEIVALLLEAGSEVNLRGDQGLTVLQMCAEYLEEDEVWRRPVDYALGNKARATYVLSSDPCRPIYGEHTQDPIRIRETIRLLIRHGADTLFLNDEDGWNSRRLASMGPHNEYCRALDNPLTVAITKGCSPMVSELHLTRAVVLRGSDIGDATTSTTRQYDTEMATESISSDQVWRKYAGDVNRRLRLLQFRHMPDIIVDLVEAGKGNLFLVQSLLKLDEEPIVRQVAVLGAHFSFEDDTRNVPHQLAAWGFVDLLREVVQDITHVSQSLNEASQTIGPGQANLHSLLLTALNRAVCNFSVVKLIISDFGIDINEMFEHGPQRPVRQTYLHLLARPSYWWQTKVLAYLLEDGADIEALNSNGETPLITALRESHQNQYAPERYKAVEVLLEHGANPNTIDTKGLTCLNIAARQPKCVHLLLKHGADTIHGIRPFLFDAVEQQDINNIKQIITSGVDVNQTPEVIAVNDGFDAHSNMKSLGRTVKDWSETPSLRVLSSYAYPIHVAASHFFNISEKLAHAYEVIELLLSGGANPGLKYEDGSSILHCLARNSGIISPFSSHPSFSTELRDGKGRTLLLAACDRSRKTETAQLWCEKINDTLEVLLSQGASITDVDFKGRNALHYLIRHFPRSETSYEMYDILLSRFIPDLLHLTDSQGCTPYHDAIARAHIDLMRFLLAKGSDPIVPDPLLGTTALHRLAAKLVNKDLLIPAVQKYLDSRGNVTDETKLPSTERVPMSFATIMSLLSSKTPIPLSKRAPIDLFTSLITRGLSINHQNHQGETPLFNLADGGALKACWIDVKYANINMGLLHTTLLNLKDAGADFQIRNYAGESVLHKLARQTVATGAAYDLVLEQGKGKEKDLVESFKWLVSQGVDVNWEDHEQRTCLDVAAVAGATWMTKLYERS